MGHVGGDRLFSVIYSERASDKRHKYRKFHLNVRKDIFL